MNSQQFEVFLHTQIPLTKAMELSVLEFTPLRVRLQAKLAPNINDKSTAFGGSISSLMTLCGWAIVFANMRSVDSGVHIVVHKSSTTYIAPISSDFTAECDLTDDDSKKAFFDTYEKRGKARIKVDVRCYDGDRLAAEYEGQYVAFK